MRRLLQSALIVAIAPPLLAWAMFCVAVLTCLCLARNLIELWHDDRPR